MRRGHTNRKRTQFKAFAEAKAAYAQNRKSARAMASECLAKELASEPSEAAECLEEYEMLCNQFNPSEEERYWINELRSIANA